MALKINQILIRQEKWVTLDFFAQNVPVHGSCEENG
jgi:hypothetical protein